MADTLNLYAESGRNIIGDDSSPTLNLENTSSGEVLKLQNAGGTGVQLSTVSAPTTSVFIQGGAGGVNVQTVGTAITAQSTATLTPTAIFGHTVLAGATIAPIRVIASTASAAFFDFRGAVISTASVSMTAATSAGYIKVWINGEGGANVGYIPILKGVV